MSTFVNTVDLKNNTNSILKKVEQGPVVITRRGHPCAALIAVEEESLEDLLWELSPKVQRKIKQGLKDIEEGRVISAVEFAKKYGK